MSLVNLIWDLFRKPMQIPVKAMPEIKQEEVRALLTPFGGQLWLSDGTYRLVDTTNLEFFLGLNPVSTRQYYTEKHDCDDFCYELMGDVSDWAPDNTFGMVWGNRAIDGVGHAWNFFIDENKRVMFVEPQTDQIFAPTTEKIWVMIV